MTTAEHRPRGTPPAEVSIDAALVAGLVADQHPDLAGLEVRAFESGWDNALFRLGGDYLVRLPRRQSAVESVDKEQLWLPQLAPLLPLAVPTPLRQGEPGRGYPWIWSIVPWISGTAADLAPPDDEQAPRLADFLRALHRPAPVIAPRNSLRGVPLADRSGDLEPRLRRLRRAGNWITPAIERAWTAGLRAPAETEQRWLHGDLHPRNVLVQNGRLVAVIDWGDLTFGDVATDLAALWMLLPDRASREVAWRCYGDPAPDLEARARGWAVFFATVLLDSGLADSPRHAAIGERIFRQLAADS